MSRSLIRSEQVVDDDFVSHAEHGDPNEVEHRLTKNVDFPTTYSGHPGKFLRVNSDQQFVEFSGPEYPRYYIEPNINIDINNYGQYVVEEVGYLEIDGNITLNTGAMIIIK